MSSGSLGKIFTGMISFINLEDAFGLSFIKVCFVGLMIHRMTFDSVGFLATCLLNALRIPIKTGLKL